MDNLKTYEFGADATALRDAHESGVLPEAWEAVFRAIVVDVVSMLDEKPRSMYLCSTEEDADARNRLAFVLARLLRERVPGVVLVDCDFLSVGMSGIVPHRDALGFLDLLLYGTSLGVIAQEAARGVKVVGAGSFAVTKKNPFAADAFVTARRYLVNQAGCVIFVGPVADDEENIHPIARNVDAVALVRVGDRFDARFLDPLEQRIASIEGVEARSIRVNTRAAGAGPARAEARREADRAPAGSRGTEEGYGRSRDAGPMRAASPSVYDEDAFAPAPPEAARAEPTAARGPFGGQPKESGAARRTRSSRVVRAIATVAALSAVVFIVWWLYMTRSVREQPGEKVGTAGHPATPAAPVDTASADTRADEDRVAGSEGTAAGGTAGEAVARREEPAVVPAEETAASTTSEKAVEPTRAQPVTDEKFFVTTLGRFADQYVIHVSSFRGTEKAKEEARYLGGAGYPVFVYHVDTGSKGMWYRVYVGPYPTRDEAIDAKIKLDENPRIRSTRVSKVPG